MKQIELKELIREVLLTEFQRGKEIESKINEFGEGEWKHKEVIGKPFRNHQNTLQSSILHWSSTPK